MKAYLVEDAVQIRDRLKSTVEDAGGQVVGMADTEADALAGLAQTRPDIAVVDLSLAQGSGIEVVRKIKITNPSLVVIVLTNFSDSKYRKICLDCGADYFMDKTIGFPLFVKLIEHYARVTP